jgi:putative transposase
MIPQTKREYLRQLVDEKNHSSRQLTAEERQLGFLGWHERGYLPHCDFPGLIQLVTFRIQDSMPESRRAEWEHLLQIEDLRERRTKLEDYLDLGHGECLLRDSAVAGLAEKTLLHFHSGRYELLAWCVMPNHIHAVVHVWQTPVSKVVKSWKQFVATQAEAVLERRPPARQLQQVVEAVPGRRPALRTQRLRWQRECWDTYMRDEEQERRAVHYTEANPVKARFCRTAAQWPHSSARFRDEYNRLVLPTGAPASGPASSCSSLELSKSKAGDSRFSHELAGPEAGAPRP